MSSHGRPVEGTRSDRERYSGSYGQSRVFSKQLSKIPMGEIFRTLQPGPAVHPASCKTGPGVFPGSKATRGVALTAHLHLAQRLSKEGRRTSTSPLRPRGLFYSEFLRQYQNKTQSPSQTLLQPQNVKNINTLLSKTVVLDANWTIPCSTVLHKELSVSQLVKKFLHFKKTECSFSSIQQRTTKARFSQSANSLL